MATVAFAAPILPGKLETWRKFSQEINGARRADFEDQQRRMGMTRQMVWLQQTPMGDFAVVMQEGGEVEQVMPRLGASDNPFDVRFRQQVLDIHGLDFKQPPPRPAAGADHRVRHLTHKPR